MWKTNFFLQQYSYAHGWPHVYNGFKFMSEGYSRHLSFLWFPSRLYCERSMSSPSSRSTSTPVLVHSGALLQRELCFSPPPGFRRRGGRAETVPSRLRTLSFFAILPPPPFPVGMKKSHAAGREKSSVHPAYSASKTCLPLLTVTSSLLHFCKPMQNVHAAEKTPPATFPLTQDIFK